MIAIGLRGVAIGGVKTVSVIAEAPRQRVRVGAHISWYGLPMMRLLAALVPICVLVGYVAIYGVNVPHWDQWEFVSALGRSFDGNFSFADVWDLHNEHRLVIPRLLMVGMAHVSGWNILWEMWLDVLLAVGLFAVVVRSLKLSRWSVALASLIVFSLAAWENWLWGWQVQILLNVLAATASLSLLQVDPLPRIRFVGALLLGAVAFYSFGNGILLAPLGACMLLYLRRDRSQYVLAGIWLAAWALIAVPYFIGFETPDAHPALESPLSSPLNYPLYVCAYLGRLVAPFSSVWVVAAAGAFGLLLLLGSALVLGSRSAAERRAMVLPLALAGYAIGSAVLTGVGRAGFGAAQALSPRYVTISLLLWVALVALLGRAVPPRFRAAGAVGLAVVLIYSGVRGGLAGAGWSEDRRLGHEALVEGRNGDLSKLHPDPARVRELKLVLVRHRLSAFR